MSSKLFHEKYVSGQTVIDNPIQLGSAFAAAFIICAIVEKLYATANSVTNTFFKVLFPAVSEEVLVLGTLSLFLTLGTSLIPNLGDYEEWAIMCDWAQACLLFMAVMFVTVVTSISTVWNKTMSRFEKFETRRLGTRGIEVDDKEQLFTLAVNKFKLAMKAYGYSKPVFLSRYLRPIGEKNVVLITNLTWKVWLALSGMVVLNALRTKLVDLAVGDDGILNVATFIVVCGYGPLALYLWVHRKLGQRCEQYLQIGAAEAAAVAASMDPNHGSLSAVGLSSAGRDVNEAGAAVTASRMDLEDPTAFLIWQSHSTTITLLQISFFFLTWFGSVFFLSMMYRVFSFNVGLSLFFFCLAMAPMTIYCMMTPWTFMIVAILSSLGTQLDEGQIRRVQRERDLELSRFTSGDNSKDGANNNNRDRNSPYRDGDAASPHHHSPSSSSIRRVTRRPIEFNDEEMSRIVYETQRKVHAENSQRMGSSGVFGQEDSTSVFFSPSASSAGNYGVSGDYSSRY